MTNDNEKCCGEGQNRNYLADCASHIELLASTVPRRVTRDHTNCSRACLDSHHYKLIFSLLHTDEKGELGATGQVCQYSHFCWRDIVLKSLSENKAVVKMKSTSWKVYLAVVVVIGVLASCGLWMLTNFMQASYSPERLASLMGHTMHRNIKLGPIKWNVRWSGLIVHADSVVIDELNGRPFVKAGPTEISIALTPLLRGEFYPKHLDFAKPEIWAVRLSENRWNFSDMPEFDAIQDVSHIACYDGKVHVLDVTKRGANHRPIRVDLTEITFKLDRPFGKLFWPYALSLTIPDTKYKTHVSVSGTGSGDLSEWQEKKYSVDANVEGADPTDFWVFGFSLPEVQGPIKLKLKGDGIVTKELKASLSMENPQIRADIKKVEYKGDMIKRLIASLPHATVGTAPPATAATVQDAMANSKPEKSSDNDAAAHVEDGTTVIQAKSIAAFNRESLNGEIKFEGGDFFLPEKKIGVEKTSGTLLCKNGVISIEEIDGKVGPGSFDLKGNITAGNDLTAQVNIHSQDFAIIKKWLRVLSINDAQEQTDPIAGVLKSAHIDLEAKKKSLEFKLDAEPAGLYYQPKGQSRIVELSGGKLHYDGKDITLEDVKGKLGDGNFTIRGALAIAAGSHLDVSADAENVDLDKARNLLHSIHLTLPKTPADVLIGTMRRAKLHVLGSQKDPEMVLNAEIGDIYVQDKAKSRVFQLTKGTIAVDKKLVKLDHLEGRIGKSDFTLEGTAKMEKETTLDVAFKAKNLEISNAKVALDNLQIQSPLLNEALLFGAVKDLDMKITGHVSAPVITMACNPDDISFEPLGSDRPMHIIGGHMDYQHDLLDIENVTITTAKSNFKTSLAVDQLSSSSRVTKVSINATRLGLADIDSYLSADKAPPMVRSQYLAILKKFVITNPHGLLSGNVAYQSNPGASASLKGKVQVQDLSVNAAGFALKGVNGDVSIDKNVVSVGSMQGNMGQSSFTAKGTVSDVLNDDKRLYDVALTAQVAVDDFAQAFGATGKQTIEGLKTLSMTGALKGGEKNRHVNFGAQVDPKSAVTIKTPFGVISKAAGLPGGLTGSVSITPTQLVVDNTQFKVGALVLNVQGNCKNYANVDLTTTNAGLVKVNQPAPTIDFHIWTPDFTAVQDLLTYVPDENTELGPMAGSFRGGMYVRGPINALAIKGGAGLRDVSISKLNLTHVTGGFQMPDWFNLPEPGATSSKGTLNFKFSTATLQKLPVINLQGSLSSSDAESYDLDAGATLAKGTIAVKGNVKAANVQTSVHLSLKNVDSKSLMTGLFDAPNEVTGTMDLESDLATEGLNVDPTKNISAKGTLNVTKGKISRMALLARRINQANLLKSGILGFNLNNVISSLAPGETGEFQKVQADYQLKSGKLQLHNVDVVSDDLHVNLKGQVNLASNSVTVDASGSVPKVSTEGPLKHLAPLLGVHFLKSVVTDIPTMLVTGKEATSSADRNFAFSAKGTLDKLESINESIYKTFHWTSSTTASQ